MTFNFISIELNSPTLQGHKRDFEKVKKMFAIRNYIFLIIILLSNSCQKVELPPPLGNEPVFAVNGTLQGAEFNITAGEEHFILVSDFRKDTNEVYEFFGRFEKSDCIQNCMEQLTIKIRDFQVTNIATGVDIETALEPGFYSFDASQDTIWTFVSTTSYDVTFDASSSIISNNGINPTYIWTIDSIITIAFQNNPIFNYEFPLINNPADFQITLDLMGIDCQSSVSQNLRLADPNYLPCAVQIVPGTLQGTGLIDTLTAETTGTPPFTYLWSNGETTQQVILSPVGGPYTVIVNDATGCQSQASMFPSQNTVSYCSASFSTDMKLITKIDSIPELIPNPFEFSKIIVEYTSPDSIFYSTEFQTQPTSNNAFFEIIAIEDFDDNPQNRKTKKVAIQFYCVLYSESGNALEMVVNEGVIGVAYPN